MLLTTAAAEGEVRPVKPIQDPVISITDRSKALLLTWFSVLLLLVSVSVTVLFLSSMCLDDV